jgi:hypothetical protein
MLASGTIQQPTGPLTALAQRVQEHGGEPRSDGWYEKVKQQESNTYTITLPGPVC